MDPNDVSGRRLDFHYQVGRRAVDVVTGMLIRQAEFEKNKRKIAEWREENPNRFTWWKTTYGLVVQRGSHRYYTAMCECGGIITSFRDVSRYDQGQTWTGRWPKICEDCSERKRDENDDKARVRMARLRASRRRTFKPKYDLLHEGSRLHFLERLFSPTIGDLVGKSLGIRCLDCGEVIKFRLDITWPRTTR
jgi:hypothetical protein